MAIQALTTWSETVSGGYKTYESEESAVNSSTGDSVASATINDDLNETKVMIGFETTVAYADVAAVLSVEASSDGGTTWGVVATASSDTTPDITAGQQYFVADLSSVKGMGPFRIHWNGGTGVTAVNVATSGKCKLSYSTQKEGVGMSSGVGADPS
jgi:hypothetical protein|tara:strand:- start:182 stop:649 length:468 start_codon:yes stop_codon:yes gene_type:complete